MPHAYLVSYCKKAVFYNHTKLTMEIVEMKKALKCIIPVLAAATLSFSAHGEEDENSSSSEKSTPNFLADCGIGGAIFKNDVGGVLSNIIWDFGLTATTSGLSSPDTCEGQDVAAAEFINQTYANITEQTAIGEGQHLSALLDLYNCDANIRPGVINGIRESFSNDLQAPSYLSSTDLEKSQMYFNAVKSSVSACNS